MNNGYYWYLPDPADVDITEAQPVYVQDGRVTICGVSTPLDLTQLHGGWIGLEKVVYDAGEAAVGPTICWCGR